MKDLLSLRKENLRASEREAEYLRQRVFEVEAILGIPHSDLSAWSLPEVRRRLDNLQAQAATRLDPDDDEVRLTPITHAEHEARMSAKRRSLFSF